MGKYDYTDLELTPEGDLNIVDGDFRLVRNQEYVAQTVKHRIKINDPEWYDHEIELIGSNLEDLRGKPNTFETAQEGVKRISQSLTRDSLIDSDDLFIKPVPLSKDILLFFVYINIELDGKPIGFEVNFNLSSGQTVRKV